jgi:pyruvate dehydrogenase E1 component alpha subunit
MDIPREEIAGIEEEVRAEVKRALATAAAAPWPDKGGAYTDIQDAGGNRWLG